MISLFSGVGGIDLGFELTGKFKSIWANEFDLKVSNTYKKNFSNEIVVGDIKNIQASQAPYADILLAGFPCQAFSLAGNRKGFEDRRGALFFEVLRFINEKKPKVVFLENVKNLLGHDNGNTFSVISDALTSHGYFIKYKVMNAKEYGNIPQNRERIYIVAFRDKNIFLNFKFPNPIRLTTSIADIIDFKNLLDERYYYTNDKYNFYPELVDAINRKDTVYQWRRKYVRENKNKVIPTLTANMGTGGHNVPIVLTDFGIRKLTPRECFSTQGFPLSYELPDIAISHLYKQAGNSVAVPVITRIANEIYRAFEK